MPLPPSSRPPAPGSRPSWSPATSAPSPAARWPGTASAMWRWRPARERALHRLVAECERLDDHPEVETTLLVLTPGLEAFDDYLDFLGLAEALLEAQGYEGTYQLASFHPDYCFEGAEEEDSANYTNRSPWPMLHLLREAGLERALEHYPDPEAIPERNVAAMRALGEPALAAALARLRDGKR